MYYLNYRYYDPVVKRFINADNPAYIGVGRSFVGFSLFAYCGNNPVTGCDPTGHWDWGGILVGLSIIASVAIAVTFAMDSSWGAGVGYDYYSKPMRILGW